MHALKQHIHQLEVPPPTQTHIYRFPLTQITTPPPIPQQTITPPVNQEVEPLKLSLATGYKALEYQTKRRKYF